MSGPRLVLAAVAAALAAPAMLGGAEVVPTRYRERPPAPYYRRNRVEHRGARSNAAKAVPIRKAQARAKEKARSKARAAQRRRG